MLKVALIIYTLWALKAFLLKKKKKIHSCQTKKKKEKITVFCSTDTVDRNQKILLCAFQGLSKNTSRPSS